MHAIRNLLGIVAFILVTPILVVSLSGMALSLMHVSGQVSEAKPVMLANDIPLAEYLEHHPVASDSSTPHVMKAS